MEILTLIPLTGQYPWRCHADRTGHLLYQEDRKPGDNRAGVVSFYIRVNYQRQPIFFLFRIMRTMFKMDVK